MQAGNILAPCMSRNCIGVRLCTVPTAEELLSNLSAGSQVCHADVCRAHADHVQQRPGKSVATGRSQKCLSLANSVSILFPPTPLDSS